VKTYIFLFILSSIFIPKVVFGEVIINEIMYDPKDADLSSGGEWIEVKNEDSIAIDLTKWLFFENDTNHGITADSSAEIPPGGYAVISRDLTAFKNYFTGFSGLLFKSSFSLNDGEKLAMKNDKVTLLGDINSVTYTSDLGAKNDGNSLQLINGKWEARPPTPGDSDGGIRAPIETNSQPQISSPLVASSFPVAPQIYAFLSGDTEGVAGGILEFEGTALGLKKEPLANARFLWNFGDGSSKEGKSVTHTYNHPGDYIVFLDVSSGEYSASNRMNVKITESNLKISDVVFDSNGESLVEIYNDSDSEVNVSYWLLKSGNIFFTFPKNSIIGKGSRLAFSSFVTKLNIDESKKVDLLYPNGSVFYSFDPKVKSLQNNSPQIYKENILSFNEVSLVDEGLPQKMASDNAGMGEPLIKDDYASLDKLQEASIISFSGEDKKSNKWMFFVGGFSIISALGFIFMKRNSNSV